MVKQLGKLTTERNQGVNNMKISERVPLFVGAFLLAMCIVPAAVPGCSAQTQAQQNAETRFAGMLGGSSDGAAAPDGRPTRNVSSAPPAAPADPEVPPAVAKELEAMKARIQQLETG